MNNLDHAINRMSDEIEFMSATTQNIIAVRMISDVNKLAWPLDQVQIDLISRELGGSDAIYR